MTKWELCERQSTLVPPSSGLCGEKCGPITGESEPPR